MNTVERLRPEPQPLDPAWSASTLERIFSDESRPGPSKAKRRRPRMIVLAGAGAAAVLGAGGVAYASGLVPSIISNELDWISSSSVTDIHEVASFTVTRDGETRAFEIWRGTNEDGLSCSAVLEADGKFGPDFGGYCGDYPTDAWFDRTTVSYKMGDEPPPATYFVYGEPERRDVTRVRVTGDGFEHRTTVDRTTGGYAVAIPELGQGVSGHFATVEFLDATGNVIGTRELREK